MEKVMDLERKEKLWFYYPSEDFSDRDRHPRNPFLKKKVKKSKKRQRGDLE